MQIRRIPRRRGEKVANKTLRDAVDSQEHGEMNEFETPTEGTKGGASPGRKEKRNLRMRSPSEREENAKEEKGTGNSGVGKRRSEAIGHRKC